MHLTAVSPVPAALSPLLRKMGLEVSNKRGPDALTEPGGPATEPRKRFKVTPRRRVPGPVDLHSNGGGKAEHRGNSEPEEAAGKKAKKANGPLKIWSSRERAVKPPCREGAWGEGIQNWWEVSLQSGTPSEEEDVAVNQGEEAEGGVGGSSEEGSGVFLTAGLVGEEAPEDGGLDITEVEGAATHEKVHSTKALANDERPDKVRREVRS